MAAIGAGAATLEARPLVPQELASGGRARLEGVIDSIAQRGDSTRIILEASRSPAHGAVRFRASLFSRGPLRRLYPGQRVLLEASLKPSEPPANPGEASYFGWRTRRGLVFSGSFDPERMAVLSPPTAMEQWLSETRTALAAHARRLAPSKEASDLYLTLAAGLRAELGEELEEEFARSGLAHVLSVSGLHVAALALFTLVGLRWLLVRLWRKARSIDARRVAAPLSIPLLWGYVIFTGSQPPAVRSAVMATVVLLGLALWRRGDPLNALAVAAMVVLVADPSCVSDLSMQLSFLAVASLLLLAPAIRQAIPLERPPPSLRPRWRLALARLREAVVGTFCASLAVTLASAPLLAAAFHRVSLAGLFSNILCLPLCGALTALAAAGAALFTVSPEASGPLLWAGTWASELLLGAAHLFASLPGASVHLPSFGPYASAAFVAGLGAWAVARGRARLFSLLAPAALVAAFALPALRPRAGLEVTFLSVGHGDAIVLSSGGESALVDGGGSPEGADTGRRFVLPYLRERRIDRLELAVLSHPHPDHALGLASTLSKVPARRLWLPAGSAEGELSSLVRAAAGSSEVEEVELGRAPFRLGEAVLEVLGPPRDRVLLEGVNDRSVVIQVRHGAVSFLLTGDVEEAGEEALPLSPVTVLKAPHHGSRTSSSPALVETTRPRYVVFCVGRGRFGLPHQEVVDRYQEAGAECLRTDLHGAIRFESDGRSVSVETFRRPERAAVARHRPAVHR